MGGKDRNRIASGGNMKKVLIIGILLLFVVSLAMIGFALTRKSQSSEITTFEECAKAGYPILESYPRQCNTPDGRTFVEIVPMIVGLSPSSGPVYTQVTISGSGFTSIENKVYFGIPGGMRGVIPDVSSPDGKTIIFAVPDGLNIECNPGEPCVGMYPQVRPGEYEVSVTNEHGTSNVMFFTVFEKITDGEE